MDNLSPEEQKKRDYQGVSKEGRFIETGRVLNRPEVPGRQETSRIGSDGGIEEIVAEMEEPEALAKARDALKVTGVTEVQSDKRLRSLTPDETAAILDGNEAALKKLGFTNLSVNDGGSARALTDVLNSLESKN